MYVKLKPPIKVSPESHAVKPPQQLLCSVYPYRYCYIFLCGFLARIDLHVSSVFWKPNSLIAAYEAL